MLPFESFTCGSADHGIGGRRGKVVTGCRVGLQSLCLAL